MVLSSSSTTTSTSSSTGATVSSPSTGAGAPSAFSASCFSEPQFLEPLPPLATSFPLPVPDLRSNVRFPSLVFLSANDFLSRVFESLLSYFSFLPPFLLGSWMIGAAAFVVVVLVILFGFFGVAFLVWTFGSSSSESLSSAKKLD